MKNSGNIAFIAEDVSSSSVLRYIDRCKEKGVQLHAFALYENNHLKVRFAPYPYSCKDTPQVFSLSKSFTGTAIGILWDEGLLSLEDRIVDLFPDKLPETVSENLREMRLKHVLSMNTGHAGCVMSQMRYAPDSVKAFLAQPVVNRPGTAFAYNTGATCLLAAVVEKITGRPLFDFASERIFEPLDMQNAYWDRIADGTSEGGTGLHISCDDIAKFGLLYLNRGIWNGQRILSEEWIREASTPHSDNSMNGSPDWTAGYGYQFWKNARWGFRGDGAMGQLCLMLPEKQIVAVQLAFVDNMQLEMDLLQELLAGLHDGVEKQADPGGALSRFYQPLFCKDFNLDIFGKRFLCEENPAQITSFYFSEENGRLAFHFSNGREVQKIVCGNGAFVQNKIWAKNIKPTLHDIVDGSRFENLHFMASYGVENGALVLQFRYLDNPVTETVAFTFPHRSAEIVFDAPVGTGVRKIRAQEKE